MSESGMLGGWAELGLALAAFLISHMLPSRPSLRTRLVDHLGKRLFISAYSVLSIVLLLWLFGAAARAPFVTLWNYEPWQRMVPAVLMPLATTLLVAGFVWPNPLSIGRATQAFDPVHPGAAGIVRHPVLWAALIWSTAHLVPNGDVAHLIVFGLLGVFSLLGMLLLDRRARRRLGSAEWDRIARHTSNIPFASLAQGWRPRIGSKAILTIFAGLALYLLLAFTHPFFAGVSVLDF